MGIIDTAALARLFPRPAAKRREAAAAWDGYMAALGSAECDALLVRFEVNNALRLRHLLATWAHETGGFSILWESGAYSAERMVAVFGVGRHSAGVTLAEARRLAGNPFATFERVYGLGNPRMARILGNTQPGDGFNFRGLSIQQLTGREAHTKYSTAIGCALADLAIPINGIHGALLEWREKGCNALADRDDPYAVCKAVNGGTNGIGDRQQKLAQITKTLTDPFAAAPAPQARDPELVAELGDEDAPGTTGGPVRRVQEALARAGFPVGDIDGKFGALTQRAVAAFQVEHGGVGTGKVDRTTMNALLDAAPEATLPGREKLDAETLAARGSGTIGLWGRVQALGRWVWGLAGGTIAGEAGGLQPINHAVGLLEQGQALAGRTGRALGVGTVPIDGRVVLLIGLVVLGLVLASWAKQGTERRVADGQTGNLTK